MQQQEIPGALSSSLRVPPAGVCPSTIHRNGAGENNDGATNPGAVRAPERLEVAEAVECAQLRLIAVGEAGKVLHALVAGKLARSLQMRLRAFRARAPDGLDQRDVAFEQIDGR